MTPRKKVTKKTCIGTLDLTPTWVGVLPTLLMVLREGNAEGIKLVEDELKRMASLADRFVATTKPPTVVGNEGA